MHPRFGLAMAAAVMALSLTIPAAASARRHPPSLKVIKKLEREAYVGDDPQSYPTTKFALQVKHVSRGTPRKGSYRHDGTPPGKTTIVFPTKVSMVYWVCYQDGSVRRDDIVDKSVFWKDDFGEWTFRLQDQKRTQPPANKFNGPCPL